MTGCASDTGGSSPQSDDAVQVLGGGEGKPLAIQSNYKAYTQHPHKTTSSSRAYVFEANAVLHGKRDLANHVAGVLSHDGGSNDLPRSLLRQDLHPSVSRKWECLGLKSNNKPYANGNQPRH